MRNAVSVAALAFLLAACGANDDTLPEGTISNPAIEAGATQSQGAVPSPSSGDDEDSLLVELDGELVDPDEAIPQEDEVFVDDSGETRIRIAGALGHCEEILDTSPSLDIGRCSYDPDEDPAIVDTLNSEACANGATVVILTTEDGAGAHVGVVGESWIELGPDELTIQNVEAICDSQGS